MANAYATTLTLLNSNDSGTTRPRHVICVHTWEGELSARKMGEYHLHNTSGSYHITIDKDGVTNRENDDEYVTWSAMYHGNMTAYHVCLAGFARFTREEWLARPKQLETLARVLAAYSKAYAIPLIKINSTQLMQGSPGVCGHLDISGAWHETDHWDPGYNFPYDVVLKRATAIKQGKETPMNNPNTQHHQLDEILTQLAGPHKKNGKPTYAGWDFLGNRTPVDALGAIGEKLGIPGMYDPKKPA